MRARGVSEGPRYYDDGTWVELWRHRWKSSRGTISRSRRSYYEGRHLFSLDGVRANHFLQRGRLDLVLPLRGAPSSARSSTGDSRFDPDGRSTPGSPPQHRETQLPLPPQVRLSTSRGACREPPRCATWMRALYSPARACPAQSASGPEPVDTAAGRRLAIIRAWSPVGHARRCAAIVRPASRGLPHRHAAALLNDVGYRGTPRMDAGVEVVLMMPIDTSQGTIRTTGISSTPWRSSGPGVGDARVLP